MRKKYTIENALFALQMRYFFSALGLSSISILLLLNFFLGTIFLLLRQIGVWQVDYWGFSLTAVPVSLLLGAFKVYRRFPARQQLYAILDGANHSGGVLLAGVETGDESWFSKLPVNLAIPSFSSDYGKKVPLLLLSFIFLVLSIVIPVHLSDYEDKRLQLSELTADAVRQVEVLEETDSITQQQAEALKKTLERMVAGSDRHDPSRTFEAFDQMSDKLKREASREAQKMSDSIDNLANLEEIAQRLSDSDQMTDEARKKEIQKAISHLRKSEDENGVGHGQKSGRALAEKLESSSGGQQSLQKAAQELKDYIEQRAREIQQNSQKLLNARLIDRKTFEQLKAEGKIRRLEPGQQLRSDDQLVVAPADVSDSEQKNGKDSGNSSNDSGSGSGNCDAVKEGENGLGNAGGNAGLSLTGGAINNGGGPAPLQFNRRTSEHRTKFIDQSLPAPDSGALDDSFVVGIGISAPEELEADPQTRSHADNVYEQGELTDRSDIILPRHRNTIKNYFDGNTP